MISIDWPGKAKELARLIPQTRFNTQVIQALGCDDKRAIGIGCSGGLDSMALLLLVYAYFPELHSRLTVLHMNHLLRGEESDEDEKFVEHVSKKLGLPICVGAWTDIDLTKKVNENSAREARHRLYDKFIKQEGSAYVLMGHHQGDVLETLMLRVARGSNLQGLSAPRPVQVFDEHKTFLRPMIGIEKNDLRTAMQALEIPWREDSSNNENDYDRNRLRNEVIPVWQASTQFNLNKAANQVREYLEEAYELLDGVLAESNLPKTYEDNHKLSAPLPLRAVLRRWIYQWAFALKVVESLSPVTINAILDTLYTRGSGQWSVGNHFVAVKGRRISLENGLKSPDKWTLLVSIKNTNEVTLENNSIFTVSYLSNSDKVMKDLASSKYSEDRTVLINAAMVEEDSLIVRSWEAGDRYKPYNSPGSKKLQDMFTDRKIERSERSRLPVVTTMQGEILWCPKLPLNEEFRITPETNTILQLTYNSQT